MPYMSLFERHLFQKFYGLHDDFMDSTSTSALPTEAPWVPWASPPTRALHSQRLHHATDARRRARRAAGCAAQHADGAAGGACAAGAQLRVLGAEREPTSQWRPWVLHRISWKLTCFHAFICILTAVLLLLLFKVFCFPDVWSLRATAKAFQICL